MEDETRIRSRPVDHSFDIVMESYAIAVIRNAGSRFRAFFQKRGLERDAQAGHQTPRSAP